MIRDRALTLEALRVMDEIDRRGSFAAAANALGRVPSALSYTIQKLEEDLDVVLFDRSGHRTKFTPAGRMLLEQGRVLLEAIEKLTNDTVTLANGWEPWISIVCEALVPVASLFPLVNRLADKTTTQLSITTEVLSGAWETLEQGQADIVLGSDSNFRSTPEINSCPIYKTMAVYVAAADHPILLEQDPFSNQVRVKYRGIAVADTARERPMITVNLLDQQPRMRVSAMADKRLAILAGLGIGSLPLCMIEEDLELGRLKEIGENARQEQNIIMAWRRDTMGEAKAWLLREIPKLFAGNIIKPLK